MLQLKVSPHLRHSLHNNTIALIQWLVISIFIGNVVGFVGVFFHISLEYVQQLRMDHFWLLYLLPLAGLLIVELYRFTGMENDTGTETVIASVRNGELVKLRQAPLIFISTILTHLTGGSAGREGAALQLGGSIAGWFGRVFKLDARDQRVITMCGMSTGFSALFGTPLSAAIFAMEVENVGVMYYAALVPCLLGALSARQIAGWFGVEKTSFLLSGVPNFPTIQNTFAILGLGIMCGILANMFCRVLECMKNIYHRYFSTRWRRVVVGGLLVIIITMLLGTTDYNGAGMHVIKRAVDGYSFKWAFLIKMFLTAVTLTAGFKGGEIVPSFFVGATFGCVVGPVLGLDPSFSAGIGLVSVFCGVTNAPMSSILLCYELFEGKGLALMALAIAISFMTSGYHSLYHAQKIAYSKIKGKFINASPDDETNE